MAHVVPNLNRLLRLGIRSKLVVAFLALSTLPLLLSGLWAVHVHSEALEHAELSHLEHDVMTVQERTDTFFEGVESDLRFLGQSGLFRRFVAAGDSATRRLLVDQVVDFARSKGIYYQIRYLDWNRGERFKVRLRRGRYQALTPDPGVPLAFYRYLLASVPPARFASRAVELSGQAEDLVAAISYAQPVADPTGAPAGVLVIDVYASYLFRIIEGAHENAGVHVALIDAEGHYLYHSEYKNDWGRLLASREEENVRRDFPAVASQIMAGTPGVLITGSHVVAHAPILQAETGGVGTYVLYMSAPRNLVLGTIIRFKRVFYGTLAVLVVLSVGLALVAAEQFTRPVNALREEASVVAGGQYGRRVQVETHDEMQELAESFNAMAAAIEEREARLRQHESALEALVWARTSELTAEKAKLQAILDAVPSAFVLLDRELRVLSASQAFERICGRSPVSVVGTSYQPFGHGDGADTAGRALHSGVIQAEVQSVSPGGSRDLRQIERIAIPVLVDGSVEQVIEILTDVTERKEMEARIIQSEKLATTGEMAALIAHEMRNSLTSVKMILQLELERHDLPETDREALGVARAAVQRMETVVTDLLKFARPSPPDLRPQSIATVLEGALSLIRHQLLRKGLLVRKDVPVRDHRVLADGDQLKEVFVNLLLNAAQATPPGGCIRLGHRLASDARQVVVEIEDDGPGIPADRRERIFDPFFTTKPDGTGLGLSTARRTVESHGGRIHAVQGPGGGALFRVHLPVPKGAST